MLLAMFLFACMDAVNKYLAASYAIVQIVWVRYLFFVAFAILLVRPRRIAPPVRTVGFWLQVVRSLLLIAEIGTFVWAFRYLPLADVHALAAITPLLVTALSVVMLGERVGWRRWCAVASGFIGVLVIVRPGFAEIDWRILIPLLGALLFAIYQILLRIVARYDRPETTVLYSAVVGAVVLTAIGPFAWTPPDAAGWAWLAIAGLLGSCSHFALAKAMQLGEASRLQPYGYTLMIWAAVLGLLAFGQFPDLWTIVGGAIIAASGLYAFDRERRHKSA